MGTTYAQGIVGSGLVRRGDMAIAERGEERAKELRALNIGSVHPDLRTCVRAANVVLLAVKPQDAAAVLEELRPLLEPGQLIVSIMAGVTLDTLRKGTGLDTVARAMPNLPAQLGLGMTTFYPAPAVTAEQTETIRQLLATTGEAFPVDSERAIDATTAISGSGPAYVFYFMKAMMDAAEGFGFTGEQAETLVTQTFRGAAELLHKNDVPVEEWIARVSSKGGTTEAAIRHFRSTPLAEDIRAGARAALDRAVELGKS